MIKPINFLWKQLNGPQITAYAQGMYSFIKDSFDSHFDYFRNFNIETANGSHLTTIGRWLGIVRPLLSEARARNFYFTEEKEHPSKNGFSEAPGPDQVGGKFSDVGAANTGLTYLPDPYFRVLLGCIADSEGYPGSLRLLDDICANFFDVYRPGDAKDYRIVWLPNGDIELHLGDTVFWDINTIYIESTLISIIESYYGPEPQVSIVYD